MAKPNQSVEELRRTADLVSATGRLSEQQALAYALRAIGGMSREEAVMEMDTKPSTADTHFQRAKQNIDADRDSVYLIDILQGNPSNLRKGMNLPVVPSSWKETPVQFEKDKSNIGIYELSDNRYAKCSLHSARSLPVEVEAVGKFRIRTPSFSSDKFLSYFEDVFHIEHGLSDPSRASLANTYQTMVEYSVSQIIAGDIISREYKFLKPERTNFADSPSWIAVNSVDELILATTVRVLESTEELRELKSKFADSYKSNPKPTIDTGVYRDQEAERQMQYYAHIGEAFCRATDTEHPLSFDWEIHPHTYSSIQEEQTNRYYEREYQRFRRP